MHKRLLKFSALVLIIFAIPSCGGESNKEGRVGADGSSEEQGSGKTISGGVMGGTLHLAMNENLVSLFPYNVFDLSSAQVSEQIFQSLVALDNQSLDIVPELAEIWTVSEDGLEYTFTLRKGVAFHDNECFEGGKGRAVTAHDVKYSFELLATKRKSKLNANFDQSIKGIVKGAAEFHDEKANEIEGVQVVDDRTVKIILTEPRATFIQRLAVLTTAIIPKEGYEMYAEEVKVGTGPFMFASMTAGRDTAVLVRNPNFYLKDEDGKALPYLDSLVYIKYRSKIDELEAFQNGKLSVISGLPASKVTEVIQEDIDEYNAQPPSRFLLRKQEMSTQYYEFNLTRPHFSNVKVRQAFNYAINRKKIVEEVLSNQANRGGELGITPPVKDFEGYDFEGIAEVGYTYDPEKARALMAEAGFPDGKGFPTLQLILNSGGTQNSNVAKEVVKQLQKELNVHVNYDILPFDKKTEEAKYGRADLFRTAWVADYPSPESFLMTLYGRNVPASLNQPSWPNTSRYRNAAYDQLLEKALKTANQSERWKLFAEAEKLMMKDAPIIVLWYSEQYNMMLSPVRNLEFSPLQIMNLEKVYIRKWSTEEWNQQKKS